LTLQARLATRETHERGFMQALDFMSVGVLLVYADGRVAFMNRVARSLAAARDGLFVDETGLRALRSEDTSRLRRYIGECVQTSARRAVHAGGTLRAERSNGLRPLEIVVSPAPSDHLTSTFSEPIAIVQVSDPEQQSTNVQQRMVELYGLTR